MIKNTEIPIQNERVELGNRYIGYTLGRDVYKDRDMLLLRKGLTLTESYIDRLKRNGVIHIYVYPEKEGNPEESTRKLEQPYSECTAAT
ncbi:hypothetical protein JOD82_001869 [Paenibacillus sp. 1182]|uniref:hypothetical protein n=1 Tax=Paenibacillus sp. 1182 TaxID=2806565 RepID=UPI001AE74B4B|nr:hypothetical protein [Paenibacillus sp. 1182]MBP1308849.1 hypothetical protein [Paenibacillus sp. 1182]